MAFDTPRNLAIHWVRLRVQQRAQHLCGRARRLGQLVAPDECSECGEWRKRLVGHHDDYRQPLSVRWLCESCHRRWHGSRGAHLTIEPTEDEIASVLASAEEWFRAVYPRTKDPKP